MPEIVVGLAIPTAVHVMIVSLGVSKVEKNPPPESLVYINATSSYSPLCSTIYHLCESRKRGLKRTRDECAGIGSISSVGGLFLL